MMHANGQPRKSKPKKSSRLIAIEASYDVLTKLAHKDIEKPPAENMADSKLPLDDDTADYFLPDEAEIFYLVEALAMGQEDFISSVAAMKAANFVHGYLHAQIEAGQRDKDGSIL